MTDGMFTFMHFPAGIPARTRSGTTFAATRPAASKLVVSQVASESATAGIPRNAPSTAAATVPE